MVFYRSFQKGAGFDGGRSAGESGSGVSPSAAVLKECDGECPGQVEAEQASLWGGRDAVARLPVPDMPRDRDRLPWSRDAASRPNELGAESDRHAV
ncbi:hypothetical protein ABT369_56050 [Dactylosporangium sp. NPDC000244]|uniref:hypothetical protein n=1 Tax=Dactylosporangium sp. NPDC000244 TaxID=3154365 RepID=UPI00333096E6